MNDSMIDAIFAPVNLSALRTDLLSTAELGKDVVTIADLNAFLIILPSVVFIIAVLNITIM